MSRHRFRLSRRARLVSLIAAFGTAAGLIAVNSATSQTLRPYRRSGASL